LGRESGIRRLPLIEEEGIRESERVERILLKKNLLDYFGHGSMT
jgi:hypothetical protein